MIQFLHTSLTDKLCLIIQVSIRIDSISELIFNRYIFSNMYYSLKGIGYRVEGYSDGIFTDFLSV